MIQKLLFLILRMGLLRLLSKRSLLVILLT
nr:MAG TPA: hypothetical protein [Caudoviricetes sp.]